MTVVSTGRQHTLVCDGCSAELGQLQNKEQAEEVGSVLVYCDPCTDRRADDPEIEFRGRRLLRSEAERQAEDEPDLADRVKALDEA